MKTILYLGRSTNIAGETITPAVDLAELAAKNGARMDVLIKVTTLTGTSPTVTLRVLEQFSDLGYVTTAQTPAISATGTYILCNGGQTGNTVLTNITYGFDMQGKGYAKQFQTVVGGTIGTIQVDVWCVMYDGTGA